MEEMHVVCVDKEICKVEGDIEKMLYNLFNNVRQTYLCYRLI